MLESARRKIESRMLTVHEDLRGEMIDHAINMALERLPGIINQADNQKLYDQYIEHTQITAAP